MTAVTVCVLLAGCGGSEEPIPGDEPITPEAIAAIARRHVQLEPERMAEWGVFTRELGEESPGAQLEYADLSLAVVVAPTTDSPLVCADLTFFDTCSSGDVDGHDVTVAWQELEPEEDPGVVYVIDRRDGEDIAVQLTGPSITEDPRFMDLGVPLGDLAALATDPRLSLTTAQGVVDMGDSIELAKP